VGSDDKFVYTLSYTNRSAGSVSSVELRLPLPAGVTFASASNGGFLSGDDVVWDLTCLAAGAGRRRQVELTVDSTTADGTLLEVSAATLTGLASGLTHQSRSRPATRVLGGVPVTLALTPNPARQGELIHVALTVTNASASDTLTHVELELYYPEHLQDLNNNLITDGGACPANFCDSRETSIWSLGNLAPGEGITVSLPPFDGEWLHGSPGRYPGRLPGSGRRGRVLACVHRPHGAIPLPTPSGLGLR
jgi:hypothetical protein